MSDITLLSIPLDRITVGPRLRPVNADYVALLAASMAETGQHTPVDVGPADAEGRHPLIAGAHRHAAALQAGLPTLLARVFTGSADEAQLLEIDENLMRHELNELDRAVFLAQRKAIYERLFPETKRGGKRHGGQTEENFRLIPRQESFAAATAARLGISDRQVRTYLARARIATRVPELREDLARSRWADNGAVLDELARVEKDDDLRRLIHALLRPALPVASLRAAQLELGLVKAPPAPEEDAQVRRLLTAWDKATARAQRAWLDALLDNPKARATVQEALDAAERRQDRVVAALAGRAA